MKQLTCPIDGKPCEVDCSDRYVDTLEGGCVLTTALELGFTLIDLGGGDVGALYVPKDKKGQFDSLLNESNLKEDANHD